MTRIRTLQMDCLLLDTFSDLAIRDEDGTLAAFWPETDFATMRCSVISILERGREVVGAGEELVRDKAQKLGAKILEQNGKVIFHAVTPSSEVPTGSAHYWYVGLGGHMAVVSLHQDDVYSADPRALHVRGAVDLLISSLRRAESGGN